MYRCVNRDSKYDVQQREIKIANLYEIQLGSSLRGCYSAGASHSDNKAARDSLERCPIKFRSVAVRRS